MFNYVVTHSEPPHEREWAKSQTNNFKNKITLLSCTAILDLNLVSCTFIRSVVSLAIFESRRYNMECHWSISIATEMAFFVSLQYFHFPSYLPDSKGQIPHSSERKRKPLE